MVEDSTDQGTRLERWCAPAFVVSGALLLVAAALSGVELVTDASLQGVLTGIPAFVGLLVSYVGLLGVYPRLVDRAPYLAHAGVALVAAPVVVVALTLLLAGASLFVELSAPPYIGAFFLVIFAGFAVGVALFGVAGLRTGIPSRAVGALLLLFAVPWFASLGASTVYGTPTPVWLDFATLGAMAVLLLAVGYLLRREPPLTERAEPASDSVEG